MADPYPILFVGSTVEDLSIAEAIQQRLEHYVEVEIWTEGGFVPTGSVLGSLLSTSRRADFALFIATAPDVIATRGESFNVMRDNVLFELGIFFGALGQERVFMLTDRAENLTVPSDLIGLAPVTMDRRKQNPQSIVGSACTDLRKAMQALGPRGVETE